MLLNMLYYGVTEHRERTVYSVYWLSFIARTLQSWFRTHLESRIYVRFLPCLYTEATEKVSMMFTMSQ